MRPWHRTRRLGVGIGAAVGLIAALLAPEAVKGQVHPGGEHQIKIKEPVESRVYQRGRDGRAEIPVVTDVKGDDIKSVTAEVRNNQGADEQVRFEGGKLIGVPAGGPYTVTVQVERNNSKQSESVHNIFVGDLWVLAGQSNMQGVADLIDVTPPNPLVMLLGMDGKWSNAEEPLHWMVDSPDPVHSGDPGTREKRSAEEHKTRKKGAGLGLPFATAMVETTRVPVGLVACAHGGTSMAQWDPGKKDQEGKSLYGSMLRQVKLAGGKVKGVLWYQGESDANPDADKVYPKVFADFIAAVRSDFEQPELPFYFVQIGRVVRGGDPKDWNAVQDAERRLAERVPNTAVVASIDLEIDDGIHVGTQGQQRLGQRLARIAERELFGQVGATTPTFDRVNLAGNKALVIKFKGVNIAPERIFPQRMPGMGGGMGSGMGGAGGQGMMQVAPGNGFRQVGVGGMGGMGGGGAGLRFSPGGSNVVGLKPSRHIAGFSIRKEDGTEVPLIFDAAVGQARDTVILKLDKPLPDKDKEKAFLWYGYGFDPYCNLTDALDMAVPVFGPVALDDLN